MRTLLGVADELYSLMPGDFVARRDVLVTQIKAHDAELARRVRALTRPTNAAWVVNQLIRAEAEEVEEVLGLGEALREAQRSMSAEELRTLTRRRRQLTAALTRRAGALARERGVRVSGEVTDRVEATLTAAVLDAGCARAVRSGMLVSALRSTGVEPSDVAAALAAPDALGFAATVHRAREDGPTLHLVATDVDEPGQDAVEDPPADLDGDAPRDDGADLRARAVEAAREELTEAEQHLARAGQDHERTGGRLDDVTAHAAGLDAELAELRRRLAALEATREDLEEDLGRAERGRHDAARALADAEEARDAARTHLARLEDRAARRRG